MAPSASAARTSSASGASKRTNHYSGELLSKVVGSAQDDEDYDDDDDDGGYHRPASINHHHHHRHCQGTSVTLYPSVIQQSLLNNSSMIGMVEVSSNRPPACAFSIHEEGEEDGAAEGSHSGGAKKNASVCTKCEFIDSHHQKGNQTASREI